jgi:putative Mg2+ transporter-C (MgtC) family protein
MEIIDFIGRLALAVFLGGLIGVERQFRQRMAGLRTNTLVSLGAAIFMTLAIKITGEAPARVASYIVSGIGFLGAGVIMKDGTNVRGLNTAATLWCSGAVGSLAGMGFWPEACISAAFVILAHLLLRPIGEKLSTLPIQKADIAKLGYQITIRTRQEAENHIRVLLIQNLNNDDQLMLQSLRSSDDGSDHSVAIISAEIYANGNQDIKMERVASRINIEQGVTEVTWKIIGQENDL